MTYDATIAIAKLDLDSGTDSPDLDHLRELYPELGFVFDLLEDKLQEAEHAAIPYQQDIEALDYRVQDLRLALDQIRELTVDVEITNIIEDAL